MDFSTPGESFLKSKTREDTKGFRAKNRMVYLNVKRGGLLEESNICKSYTPAEVKELAENFKKKKKLETLQQLRNGLCSGVESIAAFFSVSGCLTALVSCLTGGDVNLAIESCYCIINLSMGKHKTTYSVLKSSAPYLITYLRGSNTQLQDCAAWALGNMAADCNSCRKLLKEQGIFEALVHLLDSSDINVLDSTLFALNCYTKFCETHHRELCEMGALSKTLKLLSDPVTPYTCVPQLLTFLFHLSSRINDIAEFFQSEIIGLALLKISQELLNQELNIPITTALVRCVGNLSSHSEVNGLESFITNEDVFIPFVTKVLSSPFPHLQKECLWMLGNVLQSDANLEEFKNRSDVLKIIGDISCKSLDDSTILECINVLSVMTTLGSTEKIRIAICLNQLQDSLSKRPHSEELMESVIFLKGLLQ